MNSIVFWVVRLCSTDFFLGLGFYLEDGGYMLLRNVRIPVDYTVLQTKKNRNGLYLRLVGEKKKG
jgi:hypothetical protein